MRCDKCLEEHPELDRYKIQPSFFLSEADQKLAHQQAKKCHMIWSYCRTDVLGD